MTASDARCQRGSARSRYRPFRARGEGLVRTSPSLLGFVWEPARGKWEAMLAIASTHRKPNPTRCPRYASEPVQSRIEIRMREVYQSSSNRGAPFSPPQNIPAAAQTRGQSAHSSRTLPHSFPPRIRQGVYRPSVMKRITQATVLPRGSHMALRRRLVS